MRERDHWGDTGVAGRIILKWNFKKWGGGMGWTYFVQDSDRWWAVVNAVTKIQVP